MKINNKDNRPKKALFLFLIGVVFSFNIFGCSKAGNQIANQEIVVYVPSGLAAAFGEILDSYKKSHADAKISFETADSVELMRKVIEKKARPDIFIASGPLEIKPLLEEKLILSERIIPLGNDSVILVAASSTAKEIKQAEDLAKEEIKKIVIAEPKFNSSGMVGIALLKNRLIWDKIANKVVFTGLESNIFNYILENKADAAIMFRSSLYQNLKAFDPVSVPAGIFFVEDLGKNQEGMIQYGVALLVSTKNKKLAEDFVNYMVSEKASDILKKWENIPSGND